MSREEHRGGPLRLAVITVSDTRTEATDKGGDTVARLAGEAGHLIVARTIVKDDFTQIVQAVQSYLANKDIDCIITTGGTGIAKRDVTIEAITSLLTKEIPGFGEIFRYLSYTADIGTKAMASRAVAGVCEERLIFSLPGSVGAVTLGMTKLILPEIRHMVYELRK